MKAGLSGFSFGRIRRQGNKKGRDLRPFGRVLSLILVFGVVLEAGDDEQDADGEIDGGDHDGAGAGLGGDGGDQGVDRERTGDDGHDDAEDAPTSLEGEEEATDDSKDLDDGSGDQTGDDAANGGGGEEFDLIGRQALFGAFGPNELNRGGDGDGSRDD